MPCRGSSLWRWPRWWPEPCSFAAIGQQAGELTGAQLAELGLSRPSAPDASTFRKVLARLDADNLDQLAGAFIWARTRVAGGRRVIAIDGKTVRGARTASKAPPHLVAAPGHATGTVLGQLATAAKSNAPCGVVVLVAVLQRQGRGKVVIHEAGRRVTGRSARAA